MLLEELKNSPIWDKVSIWVKSNSKAQLKYIYPRTLSKDLNIIEKDCYEFLNKLVEIDYAAQNLLIECPNCSQENVINNNMVNYKFECEECGEVFTPQKYVKTNLNGVVYDIDKDFFIKGFKEGIKPFQYISSTNSNTINGKIINLVENKEYNNQKGCTKMIETKNKKIFISHCEKDEEIVKRLIKFLGDIGMPRDKEHIFCSSYTGLGVVVGEKISEYIRRVFDENIIVLFIFSENYFKSAPCLCEMGAVWIKTKEHIPIIVPPFKFEGIKGFIDKDVKGINIIDDGDLFEFRQKMEKEFDITPNITNWETDKKDFIELVSKIIHS